MTGIENREHALEDKYAHDQELLFRIESGAAKLLGLWAAQEMGLSGEDAADYAGSVVASNLKEAGVTDVTAKVSHDLAAKGLPTDLVTAMMARFMKETEQKLTAA